MVGSMCAGATRTWSPTRSGWSGPKVVCSSEQNHTEPPLTVGLPWSMPSDLRPQSATAYAGATEITVDHTHSACTNGSPSLPYAVSISTYDPAWISFAHTFMS